MIFTAMTRHATNTESNYTHFLLIQNGNWRKCHLRLSKSLGVLRINRVGIPKTSECRIGPQLISVGTPLLRKMWTQLHLGYTYTKQPDHRKLYKCPIWMKNLSLAHKKIVHIKSNPKSHTPWLVEVNLTKSRSEYLLFYIWNNLTCDICSFVTENNIIYIYMFIFQY